MTNLFSKNKGETIAETVIALTVLAIGIALSSALMANSLKNITTSKNRVIAVNIAREGLEAVRNIRDTNWLKFSGNRRGCWNHMPKPLANDVCSALPADWILPGNYIVYLDANSRWRLAPATLLPGSIDTTPLSMVDIDPQTDTSGDGIKNNDPDIYNHTKTTSDPLQEDALGNKFAQSTIFRRLIKIDYVANDGTVQPLASALNRMAVTSTVNWGETSTSMKVELKTILTDYLGRENLTN